jgi:hypothetical protein
MSNETNDIIEALRTPAGGFTRAGLESIGVPWPPPKGWRKNLIRENALATKSNVLYFPRNELEAKEEEDTYHLLKFHLTTKEYEKLKYLSFKNRKPIPTLIMELAAKYGSEIEPYQYNPEFSDE